MRAHKIAALALGPALLFAGCTSGASGTDAGALTPAAATVSGDPGTTSTSQGDTIALVEVPAAVAEVVGDAEAALATTELSNDGVLAAAVIIVSGGDLEAAIAEGIVTEEEADAAIAAVAAGTLDQYQDAE